MKRIRLDRWASQLQPPRNPRILGGGQQRAPFSLHVASRKRTCDGEAWQCQRRHMGGRREASTAAAEVEVQDAAMPLEDVKAIPGDEKTTAAPWERQASSSRNFPHHKTAIRSSKLSALHARLSLPSKLPLQTLARCLIDPSVDSRHFYNNAPLAQIGQELLGYYTAEYLLCHYPRLPMPIIFAAQHAYVGSATLAAMRVEWGVETVAAPGPEVDGGLLQLKRMPAGNAMAEDEVTRMKDLPQEAPKLGGRRNDFSYFRRGMSSRIVYDDQFGDLHTFHTGDGMPYSGAPISSKKKSKTYTPMAAEPSSIQAGLEQPLEPPTLYPINPPRKQPGETQPATVEEASARFVRAVAGGLYLHAGTGAAKQFHADHILSRHLPLHTLFHFSHPTRDLSRLCLREGFEPPVARLISETGRHSRTPVYVVGVFSGEDKLGEGAGSSLNEGRVRAAAAALRSWYLYSPSESDIVVPSDVEGPGEKKKRWKAQMVDPGEIVT